MGMTKLHSKRRRTKKCNFVFSITVVDTTSLWAAAKLLGYDRNHPRRHEEEDTTNRHYFLSLLHSIVLYDELRTDTWVLTREFAEYSDAVKETLSRLAGAIRVTAMPDADDREAMLCVLPTFVAGVREAASGRNLDPRSAGTLALVYARAYAGGGAEPPDPLIIRVGRYRADDDDGNIAPKVWSEIDRLVKEARIRGRGFGTVTEHEKRRALLRSLSIAARSVKYAAHSSSIQKEEGRPSALCASPRRMEILRGYLSREALSPLETGVGGFADLLPKLGLPTGGYDFTVMRDPLPLTALSRAVQELSAQEALDRAIALRSTPEGRQLRQVWAGRLWDSSPQVIEGHARSGVGALQYIRNVFGRDIRQEVEVKVDEMTLVIAAPAGAGESWQAKDGKILEEIGKVVVKERREA
jgi:hypothetical protein